jgi:hypothetical protein
MFLDHSRYLVGGWYFLDAVWLTQQTKHWIGAAVHCRALVVRQKGADILG